LLPKVNGLVVCNRLKHHPPTKDIPVIVVSASGGKNLEERCYDAGADDFIFKPFEARELLGKIKTLLADAKK
jgi:CheY-like chemotaxis protein